MGGELHIGNFKDLTVLNVAGTDKAKLIGDIGSLRKLQEIAIDDLCLRELPAGIGKLSSLEILELRVLETEVPELPTSLKQLSLPSRRVPNLLELKDLEKLHLSCDKLEIPVDIWKLSKLKDLELEEVGSGPGDGGTSCSSSATLPSSLNTLSIFGCGDLERLPNLGNLIVLKSLELGGIGVREIACLGELRMLENFDLEGASNLINLDGLEHLELLNELGLKGCSVLTKLPSLSKLTKLGQLAITDCPLVSEIQGLGELGNLWLLSINECDQLTGLMGLDKLESLQELTIADCASIKKLTDLSALEYLWRLTIFGCGGLTGLIGLDKLESLQELMIGGCASIKKLPDLSALVHLQELSILGCDGLTEVTGIERLESLEFHSIDERLIKDGGRSEKRLKTKH